MERTHRVESAGGTGQGTTGRGRQPGGSLPLTPRELPWRPSGPGSRLAIGASVFGPSRRRFAPGSVRIPKPTFGEGRASRPAGTPPRCLTVEQTTAVAPRPQPPRRSERLCRPTPRGAFSRADHAAGHRWMDHPARQRRLHKTQAMRHAAVQRRTHVIARSPPGQSPPTMLRSTSQHRHSGPLAPAGFAGSGTQACVCPAKLAGCFPALSRQRRTRTAVGGMAGHSCGCFFGPVSRRQGCAG